MKKTIYILIEKDFNQPTVLGFLAGQTVGETIVGKTSSHKKAKEFEKKSPFNSYRSI